MSEASNYSRFGGELFACFILEAYSRIINAEATVAQKLN
jgi:hypothetical protein